MYVVQYYKCCVITCRYGARADIRDKRGERVVHLVCTGQSRDFMAAIVEISKHDDVINAQNEAGASPLMLACQDGDTDLVTLLLEAKVSCSGQGHSC